MINYVWFVLQVRGYFKEGDIWAEAYIKWGSVLGIYFCIINYPRTYWLQKKSLLSQCFRGSAPGPGLVGSSVSGSVSPTKRQQRCPLGLQSLKSPTGKDLLPVSLRRLLAGFFSSKAVGLSVSVLSGYWPRAHFQLSYQRLYSAAHRLGNLLHQNKYARRAREDKQEWSQSSQSFIT